jgi:PAS domain S-box-containing protein
MAKNNLDLTQSIQKRLILSMVIMCVLIGGYIASNMYVMQQQDDLLAAVNVSGKQRMLSQRIALFSVKLQKQGNIGEQNDLRDNLALAIAEMEKTHNDLIKGSETRNLPEPFPMVADLYFSDTNDLNGMVKDYVLTAKRILKSSEIQAYDYQSFEALAQILPILLPKLDQAVSLYEQHGLDIIKTIKIIELFMIFLFMAMLFVIWVFVFTPMRINISHYTNALGSLQKYYQNLQRRYGNALIGSSTGVWDWDLKSDGFFMDKTMQELLSLEESDGGQYHIDSFKECIHPDHLDEFCVSIQKHIAKKERFEIISCFKNIDGGFIWAKMQGQALFNDQNIAYRAIGSLEDISIQKSFEDEINVLIGGIQAADIAFAIVDLDDPRKNFVFASKAFSELAGHSPEELMNKNINIFTGPETEMGHLDQIDYALNEKAGISLKMLSYRADGSSFWNQITIYPIDQGNKINSCTVVFEDLTLAILKERQEVVRQRNESLGSLAGSVAHEINNLLMPMSMAKDILEGELKEDCDEFAREQLDMIVSYSNQAKEIVQGILTFSRRESGDLKNANIYDELQEAFKFVQGLKFNETELEFIEPDNKIKSEHVLINSVEFKQIITNLFRNAEQAFKNQKGKITISLESQKLTNNKRNELDVVASLFVILTVKDNGVGIPEKNLEKIFEPLFTTKDIGEGTGLGLSIAMGIIKSWGGAIEVDSTLGAGTIFKIYIPVYRDEEDFSDLLDLIEDI